MEDNKVVHFLVSFRDHELYKLAKMEFLSIHREVEKETGSCVKYIFRIPRARKVSRYSDDEQQCIRIAGTITDNDVRIGKFPKISVPTATAAPYIREPAIRAGIEASGDSGHDIYLDEIGIYLKPDRKIPLGEDFKESDKEEEEPDDPRWRRL